MAASNKIIQFLRGEKPALAVTGPSGCGKKHAIAEAARQVGICVTYHDLAQSAVDFGRLGEYQLSATGLTPCAHVLCNASEHAFKDYSWVKTTRVKILLVADDVGQSIRASGVPVVRMQSMTADAMAKRLYLELDWSADAAVRAAKAARGDWHQLHAQKQFCSSGVDDTQHWAALAACSGKDETLADAPPCFIANRLLNGSALEACPLDATVMAWAERNMPAHCDNLEELAQKQEALAASTVGGVEGSPTGEALFARAARYRSQPVQYRPGLYASSWQKDEATVREFGESFRKQRGTHARALKDAVLQQERAGDQHTVRPRGKAKGKAKAAATGKAKSRAVRK